MRQGSFDERSLVGVVDVCPFRRFVLLAELFGIWNAMARSFFLLVLYRFFFDTFR